MRKFLALLSALCIAALLTFAPAFTRVTQAQDTMKHVCDSTLIALLYVAESQYGYHGMDTSVFDKGEYQPLFDAMMASMMQPTEDSMMMQPTADSMMQPTEDMMSSTAMLQPGVVQGEDAACTALRTDVEAFLYTQFSSQMMTGTQG